MGEWDEGERRERGLMDGVVGLGREDWGGAGWTVK